MINMRKLILFMLAGMMALGAIAQEGKFTVKGTFDFVGDSVFLVIPDLAGKSRGVVGRTDIEI